MQNVLVTGASRGVGLAIAKRLKADGYHVVATARTKGAALERLEETDGGGLDFVPHDFSDTGGIHAFATGLHKRFGTFYGLVNNAAVGGDGVLATQHLTDIDRILRVNLLATIVLTKFVSRHMMVARSGRIVNISSVVAKTGYSGLAVYAASKAGLQGFTLSLARELGRMGITVNSVAPGYMATDMTSGLQGEKLETIRRRSPLGRLVVPDDVAGAVAYLLGPDGGSITGATMTIDAGSTA